MQFSKLITFCTVCRRCAALRAVCWRIVCTKMCPLRAQKLLFASRSGRVLNGATQQALPRPRKGPPRPRNVSTVNMQQLHSDYAPGSCASAAVAQRILYQIGSRKGAMREPLRQQRGSATPPPRHHHATAWHAPCMMPLPMNGRFVGLTVC